MGEHHGTPEQDASDLCDYCGTVVDDKTALFAVVPDSSAIHASEPSMDGKRLLSTCSEGHMNELSEQYRRRPYTDAELWAGKVLRAVSTNPGRYIDDVFLTAETGLTIEQIHAGITWHNERARTFHHRSDS